MAPSRKSRCVKKSGSPGSPVRSSASPPTFSPIKRKSGKIGKSKPSTPSSQSSSSTPVIAIKTEQTMRQIPNGPSGFSTSATIDEDIFPDATFQSFDEFEQKFNRWRAKFLHPFRVASSETLRTENGTVSDRFKYRYVVFHCARYGAPRMRGEGKRPNQNYLPCSCSAMLRLNFSFADQCLKLTSMETRHSNHPICKELYDKMLLKEAQRKGISKKSKVTTVVKTERVSEERISDDDTVSQTSGTPPQEDQEDAEMTIRQENIEENSIVTDFYPQPVDPVVTVDAPSAPSAPSAPQLTELFSVAAPTLPGALPGAFQPVSALPEMPLLPQIPVTTTATQNFINLHQLQGMENMLLPQLPLAQLSYPSAPWQHHHFPPTTTTATTLLNQPSTSTPFTQPSSTIGVSPSQTSPSTTTSSEELQHQVVDRPFPLLPTNNPDFVKNVLRQTDPVAYSQEFAVKQILTQTASLMGPGLPVHVVHNRVQQLMGLVASWLTIPNF